MKMLIITLILIGFFLDGKFLQTRAEASDSAGQAHALMSPEEQEIRLRAKKRLYPGGKDEDFLKVQAQLPTITRRMAPTTEAPADEPDSADPAAD